MFRISVSKSFELVRPENVFAPCVMGCHIKSTIKQFHQNSLLKIVHLDEFCTLKYSVEDKSML